VLRLSKGQIAKSSYVRICHATKSLLRRLKNGEFGDPLPLNFYVNYQRPVYQYVFVIGPVKITFTTDYHNEIHKSGEFSGK